ncbi:MAG TPA: alkaline phosphatase PhoX [Gemmatimonadaceae bacterium]|nr:alkaline phosphatase PhoX [Gemmatimonadaceae bacterium]
MSSVHRREFLRNSALLTSGALIAPSLAGLTACSLRAGDASGVDRAPRVVGLGEGGYGPLVRGADWPELELPAGFRAARLSVTGQMMSDRHRTPGAHDGMGAFALPNGNVRLIRNHENGDYPANSRVKGDPAKAYDSRGGGGTTSLEVRVRPDGTRELVRDFISLNGTIVNCAGGTTPWGSWLSCEENTEGVRHGWQKHHGYIFEVPASAEETVQAEPLPAMGRFVHEAVAVDPDTGIVYETEDRHLSGFYRFIPTEQGRLAAGGRLEMLAVNGQPGLNTSHGQRLGARLPVSWVPIANPDPGDAQSDNGAVFAQGFERGGARFARLEGCWYGDRSIYFLATSGGDARMGQVWRFTPGSGSSGGDLMLVFESPSADVLNMPDNICVSPRGGVVMCEDPSGNAVPHLRGLTRNGDIFDFARNVLNRSELAGACFSPDGQTLFVNIQGSTIDAGRTLGGTFAIWGPWETGAL